MACHYRVAVATRQGRSARSAPRHHSRRRRHAAAAATCAGRRSRSRCAPTANRSPPRGPRSGHRRRRGRRRSAGRRHRVRAGRVPRRTSAARTRDLQDKIGDRAAGIAACQADARGARQDGARCPAPFAAVDAIEAGLTMDFDAGSRREMRAVRRLRRCRPSRKRMRHLFFAEREAAQDSGRAERHAHPRRSRAPPSSAPAPWAAASRWRTPTPAFRFC